ncbi:hypothetical protein PRIPAC_97308 [Pristionchus pacificus]|uniref:Uncharacterized protein n=1 Tax=Pristionchus pacificus TaxID=54126 RepID=A0A2A6BCF9_PRIPA|nr:hypothetical protein PRIPAC_97308 [Pristionchus pacificus]|eukprot:PDM63536.1 hypothetical protein PRIPAC_53893 [Pristionchus pacificus]
MDYSDRKRNLLDKMIIVILTAVDRLYGDFSTTVNTRKERIFVNAIEEVVKAIHYFIDGVFYELFEDHTAPEIMGSMRLGCIHMRLNLIPAVAAQETFKCSLSETQQAEYSFSEYFLTGDIIN